MNRLARNTATILTLFFAAFSTAFAQIPEQIEPSGPKASESVSQSPWLYVSIGAIILLIIIFYVAKKRADRKKREELNDKK